MIQVPVDDIRWAEQVREKLKNKLSAQAGRTGAQVPYFAADGRYTDKMADNVFWWTNGFWPGMLWLLYHDTGENPYRETAQKIEDRLDAALSGFEGLHHDVGFMWTLTSRMNFQLTGNNFSRVRALHAANILAGRYNPRGHFIRSWNKHYTGWVIIDCMMNLPLLYWAGEQLNDPRFRYIALEHTETALKYLVREDGSCNHIAVLNPDNGDLLETPAGQGYAPGSSWSRGQAWALYGFALALRYTSEDRFGNAVRRIARYVTDELSRRNFIPPVDYRQPSPSEEGGEPVRIDTSAGMITSAGLLCLAFQTGENSYYETAIKILTTLEGAYCDWDKGRDSIVQRGSAQYHDKPGENDVPLIYADYFFLEAVHRLLHPEFQVW